MVTTFREVDHGSTVGTENKQNKTVGKSLQYRH